MRYNATLYFNNKQSALDAGYCDAMMVDDDEPEGHSNQRPALTACC